MEKGYHFYRRVERSSSLDGLTASLASSIGMTLNLRKNRIHVHDNHVHVFLDVPKRSLPSRIKRLRTELESTEGVVWNERHLLEPISSLDPKYISRFMKDVHAPPLI